jgi:ABC-2 type transport system ATP-binding protein
VSGAASLSPEPDLAIEVDGLVKSYGGRPVVRDVSLRVARGETFALLGPNGAGKTTTVEILEGYRRADGGTVRVLGEDPARGGRDHRARVGLMIQGGGGVDPRMTGREVLALHGRFFARPRDPDELLALVGLEAVGRTRFRRLSGGERQRLGLALALVGRPELVVLDEPTAGMDVEARAATRALLAQLRADGVTIVLTSHDLGEVERVADGIAILDRGRIVAEGAPNDLAGAGGDALRFHLARSLSDVERNDLERRLGVGALVDEGDGRYRVDGAEPAPGLVAAVAGWCDQHGILVEELRTGGATLEERYVELLAAADEEQT